MRHLKVWLLLATFLPLLSGWDQALAEAAAPPRETILFPGGSLFHPPLASPKEPRTQVTWLSLHLPGDSFNLASVGFGDSFGLARWPGWGEEDLWQLGISGAVLAQFNMDSSSYDLINADYIIGLPLGYRNGPWSGRARLFHQSSHLGDEYLLLPQRPELKQTRINLSFEAVELLGGWEWEGLRLSAGPTYILHSSTALKRLSVQGGLDYLRAKPVFKATMHPFASVLWHAWEETGWYPDLSAKAGINIRSPFTEKRAIQIFGEYFHGHLPFGQFYQLRGEYFGGGLNVQF